MRLADFDLLVARVARFLDACRNTCAKIIITCTGDRFKLSVGQFESTFDILRHHHLLLRERHDRSSDKCLTGIIAVRMVCRTNTAREA